MYSLNDLKQRRTVTETTVECPVAGCANIVLRQRGHFATASDFLCPNHRIYISPSTLQYKDRRCNFPLVDDADFELLWTDICGVKREKQRLARERSEDAITYNVFRSIERAGRLPALIERLTGRPQQTADLVYWSYSMPDRDVLPLLGAARVAFGERLNRGSEPDLIAITPKDVVFIEVKVTSGNATRPSRPDALRRYEAAENRWYDEVLAADAHTVAEVHRKYELMRFWLLGSWMAKQAEKRFALISLTCGAQDPKLEAEFSPLLKETDNRRFAHWSWEAIAGWAADDPATAGVSEYLWSKSVGFDSDGRLRPMLGKQPPEPLLSAGSREDSADCQTSSPVRH
jgi:hypothetical protein